MKKRRYMVFLAVFLVILHFISTVPVQAEIVVAQQEIRVGLTSLYSGKESLTIYNTALGYGYCVGNTYLQEVVLKSDRGFDFYPVSGYLIAEEDTYASYSAAKQAADRYLEFGIEAWPGSVYQCNWRVYFGNTTKYAEAESLREEIQDLSGKKLEILAGNNYRVKVEGSFGTVLMDVDSHYAYPQFLPIEEYEKNVRCIDLGNRVYRGRIEIGRYGKATLTAVNIVGMTEYLYGVVPAEMSSTWHEEALKAQAVCARSYALVKAGYGGASNAKKGYKIVDTVSSQVYKGYLAESVKANRAVDDTKGEMICYNNKVIASYFYSTSGGRTESASDVWGVEFPYLQSVPDFYENNPEREVWQITLSTNQIATLLAGQGINIGRIRSISPATYSANGRMKALNITGTENSITLQGTTTRTLLNLYSTKFKIVRKGEIPDKVSILSSDGITEERISECYIASAEGVTKAPDTLKQYIVQSADNLWNYPKSAPEGEQELLFAGMGYGHGVGMSQYGAKGMAEAGYTYKEIIEYYFTGAYVK